MNITIEGKNQFVPTPQLLPPGIDKSNEDNQISWLTLTMVEVARILEMAENQTMKDLPELAKKRMAELKAFQSKV